MDCSSDLKDDKELLMVAVTTSVDTLLWASPRLREDKDVLLQACRHFGRAIRYTDKLRSDRDVALAAVAQDGDALQMTGLRGDAEVVKVAVENSPFALQYASEAMRADVGLLVLAARQNVKVLKAAATPAAKSAAEKILLEEKAEVRAQQDLPETVFSRTPAALDAGEAQPVFERRIIVSSGGAAGAGAGAETPPAAFWTAAPLDRICAPYFLDVVHVFSAQLPPGALQGSLAQVLRHYPPLCGRLSPCGTGIALNNKGVVFDTVREAGSITRLRPDEPRGRWTPMTLLQRKQEPGGAAAGAGGEEGLTMAVRLTVLDDGCVLGVCASHFCMDGNAFYGFLQRWAAVCYADAAAGGAAAAGMAPPPPLPPPLVDQRYALNTSSSRSKEEVVAEAKAAGWLKSQGPESAHYWAEAERNGRLQQRFGPVRFSAADLQALKSRASPTAHTAADGGAGAGAGTPFVTTNEALCAHLAQATAVLLGWEAGCALKVCPVSCVLCPVSFALCSVSLCLV